MPLHYSSLTAQRWSWLKLLFRAYLPHASIGSPLVLAGSAYIAFGLHFGPGFMWFGLFAAVVAPLPMALSAMPAFPRGPQADARPHNQETE